VNRSLVVMCCGQYIAMEVESVWKVALSLEKEASIPAVDTTVGVLESSHNLASQPSQAHGGQALSKQLFILQT
jgi:hypothetical protein